MTKTLLKNVVIGLIVLAALSGLGAHIYYRIQASKPLPRFSFDASKASGWRASDNINLQKVAGSNYKGEQPRDMLPVADLSLQHGTSASSTPADSCFVMYSYFNYPAGDTEALYQIYENKKKDTGGVITSLEPVEQTLTTFEGEKPYDLRQYDYVIEGEDTFTGYQVGFLPLDSGHVRIEGVCKTSENLALTLPVLQSVELLER